MYLFEYCFLDSRHSETAFFPNMLLLAFFLMLDSHVRGLCHVMIEEAILNQTQIVRSPIIREGE